MQKGQVFHFTHGWKFSVAAQGERYVYLKKVSPRGEISLQGKFHVAYV